MFAFMQYSCHVKITILWKLVNINEKHSRIKWHEMHLHVHVIFLLSLTNVSSNTAKQYVFLSVASLFLLRTQGQKQPLSPKQERGNSVLRTPARTSLFRHMPVSFLSRYSQWPGHTVKCKVSPCNTWSLS